MELGPPYGSSKGVAIWKVRDNNISNTPSNKQTFGGYFNEMSNCIFVADTLSISHLPCCGIRLRSTHEDRASRDVPSERDTLDRRLI